MKIFHGLGNINGCAACLAQAERQLGLDSVCIGYIDKGQDIMPDIFCQSSIYPPYSYQEFKYFANQFDIFIFYGLYSFAGSSLADIPLLKKMGKKIIFYFRGCDIRDASKVINYSPKSMCASCWPQTCLTTYTHRAIVHEYADDIWVSTKDLLLSEPSARYVPQAVDIKKIRYTFNPYDYRHINIVHSPSRPHLKGTSYIEMAINELQTQGFPISLTCLTGFPWHVAQKYTRNAHIAIDQLKCGWYGVASVEYLAQGKPTLCYLDKYLLKDEDIPIINTTYETVTDTLKNILAHHEEWKEISFFGRRYVEEKHDCINIAKLTKNIYKNL